MPPSGEEVSTTRAWGGLDGVRREGEEDWWNWRSTGMISGSILRLGVRGVVLVWVLVTWVAFCWSSSVSRRSGSGWGCGWRWDMDAMACEHQASLYMEGSPRTLT